MFIRAGILFGIWCRVPGRSRRSALGSHRLPRRSTTIFRVATAFAVLMLFGVHAYPAQPAPTPAPQEPGIQSSPSEPLTMETLLKGLSSRSDFLGDLGGLRPWLGQFGVTLSISETSEVLGNLTGGVNQGAAYDALTLVVLQLDPQKIFGWSGGLFNVSGLQIHGRNLSTDNLLTLQTASGIEGDSRGLKGPRRRIAISSTTV
jgi:porin